MLREKRAEFIEKDKYYKEKMKELQANDVNFDLKNFDKEQRSCEQERDKLG